MRWMVDWGMVPMVELVISVPLKILYIFFVLIYYQMYDFHIFSLLLLIVFSNSLHFKAVQFSSSVVSDFLQPHESQHARLPCPSPTPRVYSNSSIESVMPFGHFSSVVPFSSCPQSLPASESFPMSQFFA